MVFSPKLKEFLDRNKKPLIINVIAIAALLFFSLYYLVFPLNKEIRGLKQTKTLNEAVLGVQQTLIGKQGDLKDNVERLNIAIPGNPQILKLGSSFQTMAVSNGMLLKSITFKDALKNSSVSLGAENLGGGKAIVPESKTSLTPNLSETSTVSSGVANSGISNAKGFNKIVFTASLTGSETNFKKFLQTLENNLRLIDVVDMQLPEVIPTNASSLSSGKNTANNINTYTLELNGYFLR